MSKQIATKVFKTVLETQHPFRAETIQDIMNLKGERLDLTEIREYLRGLVSPGHVLTIDKNYYKLDSSICLI